MQIIRVLIASISAAACFIIVSRYWPFPAFFGTENLSANEEVLLLSTIVSLAFGYLIWSMTLVDSNRVLSFAFIGGLCLGSVCLLIPIAGDYLGLNLLSGVPSLTWEIRSAGGFSLGMLIGYLSWLVHQMQLKGSDDNTPRKQQKGAAPEDIAIPDWIKNSRQAGKEEIFAHCKSLQRMPRIFEKLKLYWGHPDFFDLIEKLLTMEKDREDRQGFNPETHKELMMLRDEFVNNVEQHMASGLKTEDKNRIRTWVEKFNA